MKGSAALAGALCEASRMVARVASGTSLTAQIEAFDETERQVPRSALIDLTHGTLRRYGRGPAIVRELSRRGRPDGLVEALLWCALYALDSGRYAAYTVVDQAVRACALLERWTAKGYVNGLLRSYLREREALEARLIADQEARHQHPGWWIDLLRSAYPQQWESVLQAGNTHPPMCLRINRRRTTPSDYGERLRAAGIAWRPLGAVGLLLEQPVPLERLPGFEEGDVSVQDAGAQRAARCLDLAPGQRVLDACAAPGGKAAHILEAADVDLTALDVDPERCERIARNLERLQLAARVHSADCTRPHTWWDGRPYQRILADVPCSASGVARRHPDLKWLRRAGDIGRFAERQAAILHALWQLLSPGGKLLYVTCSVFPAENDDVIAEFVSREAQARRDTLPDAAPAQWLPGPQHDGFYCALITKQV